MVYENTHLWAAEEIRRRVGRTEIADILATHVEAYHLGAVFPDILYFHKDPKVRESANFLHGEPGSPTNIFVFEILDRIRGKRGDGNLAFICGFLTHCALDIVFHPMVFYFSGYHPRNGPAQQVQSAYLHWHYETLIDRHFNGGAYLERLVDPAVVDDLKIPALHRISKPNVKAALKRQIYYFHRIHSPFHYRLFKVSAKFRLLDKLLVAGFYANLDADKRRLPQKLVYRDIISGEQRTATLDGLMAQAIQMAVKMIAAAGDYQAGNIDKAACRTVIAGHNLDTGQVNRTKADIRFFIKV
jgi:hypothetical protein